LDFQFIELDSLKNMVWYYFQRLTRANNVSNGRMRRWDIALRTVYLHITQNNTLFSKSSFFQKNSLHKSLF